MKYNICLLTEDKCEKSYSSREYRRMVTLELYSYSQQFTCSTLSGQFTLLLGMTHLLLLQIVHPLLLRIKYATRHDSSSLTEDGSSSVIRNESFSVTRDDSSSVPEVESSPVTTEGVILCCYG